MGESGIAPNSDIIFAQGTGQWDAVVTAFVDGWAQEYNAVNN